MVYRLWYKSGHEVILSNPTNSLLEHYVSMGYKIIKTFIN